MSLDKSAQEIVIVSVKQCFTKLGVFYHQFLCEIKEVVLAVKEEKVLERLRWEKRVVQKKVEFFHRFRQVFINIHHSLVVKGNRVKTFHIGSLRYAANRPLRIIVLALQELNCSFEI